MHRGGGEPCDPSRGARDGDADREPGGGDHREQGLVASKRDGEHEREQGRGRQEQRVRQKEVRPLHPHDEQPPPVP